MHWMFLNKIAIYYLKPLLFIDMDDFSCLLHYIHYIVCEEKTCRLYLVWHDVQKSNSPYFIDSQVLTMIIINRGIERWSVIL